MRPPLSPQDDRIFSHGPCSHGPPRVGIYDLEVVVYSAVAGAIDHSLREVDAREVRGEVPEERSAQPRPAPRVHHLFRTKIFLHVRIPSLHVLYVLSLVKN